LKHRAIKTLFITTLAALLFCGCVSDKKPATTAAPYRPEIGVTTKQEIQQRFGEPNVVSVGPKGEAWGYSNVRDALIPFNFGFKLRQHTFLFTDGVLSDFVITQGK